MSIYTSERVPHMPDQPGIWVDPHNQTYLVSRLNTNSVPLLHEKVLTAYGDDGNVSYYSIRRLCKYSWTTDHPATWSDLSPSGWRKLDIDLFNLR